MVTATDTLTIRQSHLTFYLDQCRRGAYALAIEGLEGPHGIGAERGLAIHDFFARYNQRLFLTGRSTDWDGAREIVEEVLTEYTHLDMDTREDVRHQASRIAEGYLFDADGYYGAEESLSTEIEMVDGRTVTITGRLDLLMVWAEEALAEIRDVKGNHNLPPDSAVRRNTQLRTYSMLALDNLPQIETVRGWLWFSRYGVRLPHHGEALWTREDTELFKRDIAQRLPALFAPHPPRDVTPGTWCCYCPLARPGACSAWRKRTNGSPAPLRTYYQARKVAARVIALEQEREVLTALLKDYANEYGPVRVGDTAKAELFGFRVTESEEIDAAGFLQVIRERESEFGPWLGYLSMLKVNKQAKGFKGLAKQLGAALEDVTTMKPSTRFTHWAEGGDDD